MPILLASLSAVLSPLLFLIEAGFFKLIRWYDEYVYSPLQTRLSPVILRIPRHGTINGVKHTIFSANIVSYARTFLAIPIIWLVKYGYYWTAFCLVLLHDFLDHVDGIVAKVHRSVYGLVDDPLLGGFMDAFCDKIVNVTCLWSILILTDFSGFDLYAKVIYIGACAVIIAYEFILGVVRVQDYFASFYKRLYLNIELSGSTSSAAVMEGKLKEKLESMGIAFLCLSQAYVIPIHSIPGIVGVICLALSIRLAHASLQNKLKARSINSIKMKQAKRIEQPSNEDNTTGTFKQLTQVLRCNKETQCPDARTGKGDKPAQLDGGLTPAKWQNDQGNAKENRPKPVNGGQRRSLNSKLDIRADKVYTVGCFDLFHHGHVKLLQKMKTMGRQVVVGVHDDHSIQLLKNRAPVDNTEKRMNNVKKYADVVYCVAGTDPWVFLKCIMNKSKSESCLYVRGDDMPNFPARSQCEKLMPVKFLPYTQGVSSTKLRELIWNVNPSVQRTHTFEDDDYSLFY